MEDWQNLLTSTAVRHIKRILIFMFAIMIGMAVAASTAHGQTKTAATKSAIAASPAPAKEPMPLTLGTVSQTTDQAITLTLNNGQTTSFKISVQTRFEAPGITSIKTKPTVKNLGVGDKIAVASADQSNASVVVIAAKANSQEPKRQSFLGVVSSRDATSSGTLLSLKHPKQDQFAKVMVTNATKMSAKGIDKPTVDDIKAGDKVIAFGPVDSGDVITARLLYLIPGKARGLLDKLSSPSAQPKATSATGAGTKTTPKPSASPATTPKATTKP